MEKVHGASIVQSALDIWVLKSRVIAQGSSGKSENAEQGHQRVYH